MSKTIALKIKLDGVEQSVNNMESLNNTIREIESRLEKADFGSDEFNQLSRELVKARNQVRDLDKELEGLDSIQRTESFLKLGEGIAGSFAIAQGAIGLFGEENEELEKTMVKVQSAISIAVGARAAAEGLLNARIAARIIQEKALAAQMVITNVVVGQSTGAMKAFRIALASTGVGLLVIALGSLIANFEEVKKWVDENVFSLTEFGNKIQEVGAGIKTFFTEVGGALASFFTGDFREAVDRISNVPDNVVQAAKDTQTRIQNELAEEQRREALRISNNQIRREIQLLEAQGRDTYRVKEKLLRQELELLEEGTEEYADKLNEIRILNAKKQEEIQQQSIINQRKLNDELVKEFERYNKSLEFLTNIDVPEVKALEDLNFILDRQREILTDSVDPLVKFNQYLNKVEVPNDTFGGLYEVLRNILTDSVITKSSDEFDDIATSVLDLAKSFNTLQEEELFTDEGMRKYQTIRMELFKLVQGITTDDLPRLMEEADFALRNLGSGTITDEAISTLEAIVKGGYSSVLDIIEDLGSEARNDLIDSLSKLYDQENRKKLELIIEDGVPKFEEVYTPFNADQVEITRKELEKAFQEIYNLDIEENQTLFDTFEENLKGLVFNVTNTENEIRKIFSIARQQEDTINDNIQEGTMSRLRIASTAYVEYIETIKNMDEEYLYFNREKIMEEIKQVQERYNQEVEMVKENTEEKNQLVLDSVNHMVELEMYLTDMIQQEEEKRKQANQQRILDNINNFTNYIDSALNVVNTIGDMVSDLTDLQLQQAQRRFDTEIDMLDARLQAELEGVGNNERLKNRIREKYDKERLKAEQDFEAEQRKIRKKQLTLEFASNILSIISETAKNITQVFPNPFLMAAAGALGAAQGAVATKVYNQSKKLRRGGMLKGPSHSQGGIPIGDYEVEGGEVILPKEVGQNATAMAMVNQAMVLSGQDALNKEVGRFDNQVLDEMRGYFNKQPIIKTYVVSGDIDRESYINKQIENRSRL